MDEKTIASVNGLIMLDRAAAESYEIAAGVCTVGEIKQQLRSFKADHERHANELSDWIRGHGVEPPTELGETAIIIRGYTALSSLEDRSAVLAMRGNEELTNTAYAFELRADLPEELVEIIGRNFEDERRHISWIREEIRARGWDHEPAEVREVVEGAEERRAA